MDLNRVSDSEKLNLCKRYFIGGFFALPILWLVNFVWFFKQAFMRPWFEEQKNLRFYVACSFVGFLVYTIPLVSWTIYYQKHRVDMGELGKSLAFITPAGRP